MRRRRSNRAGGVVAIVAALVLGLGVSCTGFRQDEIECERAVIHLVECCPNFRASAIDCSYSEGSHCLTFTHTAYPAISVNDSYCLQAKSCADLVDGDCARAQSARRRVVSSDPNERGSDVPPPVCSK